MKQHLSEPRPGAESVMERRAHADRCKALPKDLPDDVDLMIEAKDKVGVGSHGTVPVVDEAEWSRNKLCLSSIAYSTSCRLRLLLGSRPDALQWIGRRHSRQSPPSRSQPRYADQRSQIEREEVSDTAQGAILIRLTADGDHRKTKETGMVDEDGNPVELDDVEKEGDGGVGDEAIKDNRIEEPSEEVRAEASEKIKVENVAARGGKRGRKSEVADEAKVDGMEPEGPKKRGRPKKVTV